VNSNLLQAAIVGYIVAELIDVILINSQLAANKHAPIITNHLGIILCILHKTCILILGTSVLFGDLVNSFTPCLCLALVVLLVEY